jgi:hypothetical protein
MAQSSPPSRALIGICGAAAVLSMAAGVYFGGEGRLPLAMTGSGLFVLLGSVTFELARRRSMHGGTDK